MFNFNDMINDPQFQSGLGILGASRKPNGLMQAYQILNQQRMQQADLEAQKSQRALEQERMGLYRQQVEQSQANTALQQQKLELQQRKMDALGKLAPLFSQMAQGAGMQLQPTNDPVNLVQQIQSAPDVPPDLFESKLLPLENKRNPDGTWPVSPKGAVGPAQVMPDTGPEAAALAGLPWEPERLGSDEQYNLALGKAYFKEQLRVFGNAPMAFAAYNAGPGAVRNAIKRSKQNFGNDSAWYAFLPKETKPYVTKGTGYSGGMIPQGLSNQGVETQYAAQMQRYKQVKGAVASALLEMGDESGLTMGMEAMKPDLEVPKLQDQQRRTAAQERNAATNAEAERRHAREFAAGPRQKQMEELNKGIAKDYLTYQAEAVKASSRQQRMELLVSQLEKVGDTGKLTPIITEARMWLKSAGIEVDPKATDAQVARIMGNQLAMELRDPSQGAGLPGQMTEWETQQLRTLVPNTDKDPRANRMLAEAYIKQQQRTQAIAKIYRDYRKANGGLDEAVYDKVAEYMEKNPIFDKQKMEAFSAPAPAPDKPMSLQEYYKSRGNK